MKTLALGALCLAIGLVTGVVFAGSSSPPVSAVGAEKDHARNGSRTAGLSRQELAVVVREELARNRVAGDVNAAVQVTREPVANETVEDVRERMTDEQVRSADRAVRIVDDAIARGAWTEQNKVDLRVALSDVPGPVQLELFQRLGVAINANRLRVETEGMPL